WHSVCVLSSARVGRTCDKFFLLMRAYYNEVRTHLALGKDAPLGQAVQRTGVIVANPNLVWAAPPLRPDMIFGRHTFRGGRARRTDVWCAHVTRFSFLGSRNQRVGLVTGKLTALDQRLDAVCKIQFDVCLSVLEHRNNSG